MRRVILAVLLALSLATPALAAPEGQLTYAVHISLVSRWFDPGELEGLITPFIVFYALHDALVKSMPGQLTAPSLAESWTVSKDGTVIDFALRKGVTFHNGDPFTAEDVKFTFQRYRGSLAKLLKERVRDVEIVTPHRVRFHLNGPWPDFFTVYGTPASGAGWILPKRLVYERVMFALLWQYAILNAVAPTVADARFGAIASFPYSAPYEEIRLRRP